MNCFICLSENRGEVKATWLRVGFSPAMREVKPVCGGCVKRFEYGHSVSDRGRSGVRDGWAIRPLAGAAPPDWRDAVTPEAWQAEINTVCEAVERAFPDAAPEIFSIMRSAGDHYSFTKWGMYVGVEPDGYVHS